MNLNDLSSESLNDLENYINHTLAKTEPAIQTLFKNLKNGNLKNKNVDTDALDFIYDGLTNLFEEWNQQNKSESSITSQNIKELNNLFKRDLIFSQNKSSTELQHIVSQLLNQYGYPNRSENLHLRNVATQNSKFIKGNSIYLLRGAEAGQMSGFFTYPYCTNKMNLEEYCKKFSQFSPDKLLEKHSIDGKGYFVSATTKLPFTTHFTREIKNQNGTLAGSIYIIKINKKYAFRRIPYLSQFDNPLSPLVKLEDLDEDEYLISDYIMPNELLKEFKYTDYIGVFKYLTENIGLDITPQDLGIQGAIENVTEEYIKEGDFLRKTEAKIMEDWKNHNWAGVSHTLFQEFSKKFDEERE